MSKRPQFVQAVFDLYKMSEKEAYDLGYRLGNGFKLNKVVSFGYKNQSHCEWTKQHDGIGSSYKAGCGDYYQMFNFGDVRGNGFEYCPYCGMEIIGGDDDI